MWFIYWFSIWWQCIHDINHQCQTNKALYPMFEVNCFSGFFVYLHWEHSKSKLPLFSHSMSIVSNLPTYSQMDFNHIKISLLYWGDWFITRLSLWDSWNIFASANSLYFWQEQLLDDMTNDMNVLTSAFRDVVWLTCNLLNFLNLYNLSLFLHLYIVC